MGRSGLLYRKYSGLAFEGNYQIGTIFFAILVEFYPGFLQSLQETFGKFPSVCLNILLPRELSTDSSVLYVIG
jgi:hypothetical protein